jgi:MarR family 2-MHQ and catechol resistance regulon transcriptional repressor
MNGKYTVSNGVQGGAGAVIPAQVADDPAANDTKISLRVWLYMLKCVKHLEQNMSGRFRSHFSSSLSRFDVLAHLDRAGPGGLSTSQLASRLLASRGNITRLLDRMEDDGLVCRGPQVSDRRISNVRLSPAGAELFRRMAPEHEVWSHEALGGLSSVEKEQLVSLLRRIREHSEQAA